MYDYFQECSQYSTHVHREILDLFIKKDIDRVEALVKDHIMSVLDWYVRSSTGKDGMRAYMGFDPDRRQAF